MTHSVTNPRGDARRPVVQMPRARIARAATCSRAEVVNQSAALWMAKDLTKTRPGQTRLPSNDSEIRLSEES